MKRFIRFERQAVGVYGLLALVKLGLLHGLLLGDSFELAIRHLRLLACL